MTDYDIEEVERLTGFSEKRRRELTRYYADLPDLGRIEAHKFQTDLARQNRKERQTKGKSNEFFYAYLLIALNKMHQLEKGQSSKQALSEKDIERLKELRINRVAVRKKKPSPTKEMIEVRFFELIKELRETHKLGWHKVSTYIATNHKKRISHTYLKKCFEQIVEERKMRGDM